MDRATVDKLLTTTRSVRRRLDLTRPVDPAVIEECLELAVQAPQGSNLCRYHFMIVTDAAIRARLGDLYRQEFSAFSPPERLEALRHTGPTGDASSTRDVFSFTALAEHFQDVPTLIFPCVEGRPEGLHPERLTGLYGNILPMAWSLMLALRSRGSAPPGRRLSSSTKQRSRASSASRRTSRRPPAFRSPISPATTSSRQSASRRESGRIGTSGAPAAKEADYAGVPDTRGVGRRGCVPSRDTTEARGAACAPMSCARRSGSARSAAEGPS